MYILHIETATKVCSVALSRDSVLLTCRDTEEGMNHTAMLTPMIEALMAGQGLHMKDLGAVSVSSGPGSYTGLRVGGATAKAIAFSLKIPLVPVSTLFSLACEARERFPDAGYIIPMLDARRNEVYAAMFDIHGQTLWRDSAVILTEEWLAQLLKYDAPVLLCGDGASKVESMAFDRERIRVEKGLVCSARHLVGPAASHLANGEVADVLHFVPSYLKPPNITQPRKQA